MRAQVAPIDGVSLARATQLVNKTNQFNLTTRRLTESEVQALAADPTACTLTVRLADRFGDHGLVSVLTASQRGHVAQIDDWLMSCRVLKRGVERMVLERLADWADEHGVVEVHGKFVPTGRNELVRTLLDDLGFERLGEFEGVVSYRLVLSTFERLPHFINIEREVQV
jgi:FkbH-like protein